MQDRHITTESTEEFLVAIERVADATILVQFSQKQMVARLVTYKHRLAAHRSAVDYSSKRQIP